jgi:eukaryotic-like serine/threonine-protein kinase
MSTHDDETRGEQDPTPSTPERHEDEPTTGIANEDDGAEPHEPSAVREDPVIEAAPVFADEDPGEVEDGAAIEEPAAQPSASPEPPAAEQPELPDALAAQQPPTESEEPAAEEQQPEEQQPVAPEPPLSAVHTDPADYEAANDTRSEDAGLPIDTSFDQTAEPSDPRASDAEEADPKDPPSPEEILPVSRPSMLPAELLAGKYRLLAALGRGGMASVYLGAATGPAGFNKLVVIKKLHEVNAEDPSFVTMFLDEARVAARLNHSNVVQTYEVGETNGSYLIVMEYLEGQSFARLSHAARQRGVPCSPALAAHLMAEALLGLHYAHEMCDYDGSPLGIIHRDVSPHNLFVTYEGQVKVLDFGVAKATLNASNTHDGVLKGKFAYMAPELPAGGPLDRRADIFSAGVVLWELLTGERLFRGGVVAAIEQAASGTIRSASSVASEVPPELDEIVAKALARTPEERFATALEMSNALAGFLVRSGQIVRREDVARIMQELFADVRQTIAQTIQTHMASRAGESTSPPDAVLIRPSIPPLPPLPAIPEISARSEPAPAQSLLRLTQKAKRALPIAVSAVIAASLGIAGTFLLQPKHAPAAPAAASARAVSDVDEVFHLALGSDPPETQVEWGGKVVGQTPLLIDLLPGPQTFVLTRDGYLSATVVVNVVEGMAGRSDSRLVVLEPRTRAPRDTAARASKGVQGQPVTVAAGSGTETKRGTKGRSTSHSAGSATTPPAGSTVAAAPQPAVAPPQPTAATTMPFGPEMTRPVLLSGSDLVYTREAIVTGTSGSMIAKCTITTEGTLRNCRIIKGLPYLDKAMLDSLATRRYTPVTYQGKPVSVEYIFNLRVPPP